MRSLSPAKRVGTWAIGSVMFPRRTCTSTLGPARSNFTGSSAHDREPAPKTPINPTIRQATQKNLLVLIVLIDFPLIGTMLVVLLPLCGEPLSIGAYAAESQQIQGVRRFAQSRRSR